MLSDFKKELAQMLDASVVKVLNGSKLVNIQFTDEGLYCDFDTPAPFNPTLISAVSDHLCRLQPSGCYQLERFSGVYESGDSNKRKLQRIYMTAFETKEEFDRYKAFVVEASLRDHKALGAELKLFSTSEDIGQGLVLWHPKGAMLRYLIEQFGQTAHILNGYQWVYTPHIGKVQLWETSGHLGFYRDAMYSPISIEGEDYYLKPMNCPFHINIYNSEIRSYRDLPIRLAEYGTVYRYELSGALNGMTRVRGFTQDDAHIICTPDQIEEEVANALKFSLYILRSFGFEHFNAYVSTKPQKKSIGHDEAWQMATEVLKNAVVSAGLEYRIDEGGGAFYGPKIDLKLKDALNREWQCSTIQFDFNLPTQFKMSYIGNDGEKHTPYMVHRALFGSLERFTALLIEHYKGEFPFWLTPVQVGIVPIKLCHNYYGKELEMGLKKAGFRVKANYNDIHMRNKIKTFELEKIPYLLIVGDQEMQCNGFSVRCRQHGDLGRMNIDGLCDFLKEDMEGGKARVIFD